MAKKSAPEPASNRGLHDLIGIILMGCSILLLIAFFSYDPYDSSEVLIPRNRTIHNARGSGVTSGIVITGPRPFPTAREWPDSRDGD